MTLPGFRSRWTMPAACARERVGDLTRVAHCVPQRHPLCPMRFASGHPARIHRDEPVVVGLTDVVDGDDMRMVEGGGGLRFLHEALPLVGTADSVGGKDLQGDEPVQTRVTGLVDDAHATSPRTSMIS